MHISKKHINPETVEATISLEKEELAAYLLEATEALSGQVTIEGFRKGKAPKELVEKQIDPALIRAQALEVALEESFTKATEQESWDVMRTTDLKVLKNDANALEYSVKVVLWPAVTLPDLATVKVPRRASEVSAPEIDEALDTLRNMRATFLDKTGSAVEGDRVEIDFDAAVGGKPIEGGSSRNHPLVIGGKSFMPGFEEELIGLSAGQKKEFSLTAPKDYYEPSLAGKQVDFTVTANRVQAVLKPAADDAFAKSLGSFENLDQLKDNLREGIIREKDAKEHQRLRLAILDAVIAAATVPAPQALVAEELDSMVHRFSDDLKGRGIELPMYLARLKKTEEDLRKEWHGEAERQVRIMLVLREVAKDKNIMVPPQELDDAIKNTVTELMRAGHQQDQIDLERLRSALAQRIMTDKTLEFIEGVCAIEA